jgi:transaldolase
MPDTTSKAFADHGQINGSMKTEDVTAGELVPQFIAAGIDLGELGSQLQEQGAKAIREIIDELMRVIGSKSASLKTATL